MYIHLSLQSIRFGKEMTMTSRLLRIVEFMRRGPRPIPTTIFLILVALTITAGVLSWAETDRSLNHNGNEDRRVSSRPELEYLKAVNSAAPPQDPQLLFLLMGEFANANQQAEGAEFLSARLNEFAPRLTDAQKALYLSAIGLLRAQHASSISLFRRIGYVKDTIAMLDQAKKLSGGQIFVVNWISGVVRSELPGFFHQKQAALDDLRWCEANIAKAPHVGWLREVDFRLGKLALADGDRVRAQEYLGKAATRVSTSRLCSPRRFQKTRCPYLYRATLTLSTHFSINHFEKREVTFRTGASKARSMWVSIRLLSRRSNLTELEGSSPNGNRTRILALRGPRPNR